MGSIGFRFLLLLENGEPADPAVFTTANPQWSEGDRFQASDGSRWRIVRLAPELLADAPFDGAWVVEPMD